MKNLLLIGIVSFAVCILTAFITIPLLRKLKAGQTVLHYVETHKQKNGTPTMGGLFFIIPAVIIFFIFSRFDGVISNVSVVIGLSFLIVGFIDDFIKIKFKKNQGLKAYQKIIFQFGIALVAGFFSYLNGITVFYIPFVKKSIDLGLITIPFVALIFIAITNCVNLTDGLDGLAGGVSAVYFATLAVLIGVQVSTMKYMYLKVNEYYNLQLLCVALVGGICAFLIFNVSKAKVFMGDTGSLSLGGFIGAVSIFSSNSFFIPIIGIMFVLSGISVILQVLYFKKTKERIFLMAPIHHHFQLKGFTETQISFTYSLITILFGVLSVISYM